MLCRYTGSDLQVHPETAADGERRLYLARALPREKKKRRGKMCACSQSEEVYLKRRGLKSTSTAQREDRKSCAVLPAATRATIIGSRKRFSSPKVGVERRGGRLPS